MTTNLKNFRPKGYPSVSAVVAFLHAHPEIELVHFDGSLLQDLLGNPVDQYIAYLSEVARAVSEQVRPLYLILGEENENKAVKDLRYRDDLNHGPHVLISNYNLSDLQNWEQKFFKKEVALRHIPDDDGKLDTVWEVVGSTHNARSVHQHAVKSVGSKFVTLEDGRKFHLDGRSASTYGVITRIFASKMEAENNAWMVTNRYKIAERVERCTEAEVLRKIAAILDKAEVK